MSCVVRAIRKLGQNWTENLLQKLSRVEFGSCVERSRTSPDERTVDFVQQEKEAHQKLYQSEAEIEA